MNMKLKKVIIHDMVAFREASTEATAEGRDGFKKFIPIYTHQMIAVVSSYVHSIKNNLPESFAHPCGLVSCKDIGTAA